MPAAERVFWRHGTASVWVGYSDAGELVSDGQDTENLDGYEYRITVASGQFDRRWAQNRVLTWSTSSVPKPGTSWPGASGAGWTTTGSNAGSFPTSVGGHGFNRFGVAHPVCRRGAVRTRLRVLVRRGSAGSIARDSGHGGNAGARDGASARMR